MPRASDAADVGLELRQARERQGLSLRDLSDRTKIGVSTLRAIEANDIERLPGGIFTRGFLKSYAREVGLDPAETTARFTSQFEPPPQEPEAGAARVDPGRDDAEAEAAEMSRYTGAISAAAAFLLVAACLLVLNRLQAVGTPAGTAGIDVGNAVEAAPAPAPRAEVGTAGSTAVAPPSGGAGLRIELHPAGECWVSVAADGNRVVYRLMQPGERQTIEARETIELRVGDGQTCGFSINGMPARPLGRAGEAVTTTIEPDNYRTFIE